MVSVSSCSPGTCSGRLPRQHQWHTLTPVRPSHDSCHNLQTSQLFPPQHIPGGIGTSTHAVAVGGLHPRVRVHGLIHWFSFQFHTKCIELSGRTYTFCNTKSYKQQFQTLDTDEHACKSDSENVLQRAESSTPGHPLGNPRIYSVQNHRKNLGKTRQVDCLEKANKNQKTPRCL